MFKVRYYANIDEEGPTDLKMFRYEGHDLDRSDFIIRSFSKIQRIEHILDIGGLVDINTIKNLLNVIMFNVDHDSDNYNELAFKNMFISYKFIDNSGIITIPETAVPQHRNKSEIISLEAKHIKSTMDLET